MALNDSLLAAMKEAMAAGMRRRTLTSCTRWSEACVVMGGADFPGPIRWRYHPWLYDMHDTKATWTIGQKAAQMGYTVAAMNRALYALDAEQRSVLYLLPTKTPDATDFSATRFDPLLELSPHLEKLFSDVRNVATKRAGASVLYIRGANSRSGLKSIPVSFIVFDEYDEMNQENIALAIERTSGQLQKQFYAISTPTVPGMGINKLFLNSTQEHFVFPCPMCGVKTELVYPDSIVICGDSLTDPDIEKTHLICKECSQPFPTHRVARGKGTVDEAKADMLQKAYWEAFGHADFENRGFYINQMYSPTIKPVDIAKTYFMSLSSPSQEQELHNSKMGMPHVVDGARISEVELEAATRPYKTDSEIPTDVKIITMGIDVGKWLHIVVCGWYIKRWGSDLNMMSDCRVLADIKVPSFEDLGKMMYKWKPLVAVIDANPERRKAYEFATKFRGHVKLCTYGKETTGKLISIPENADHAIRVDRTSWLDTALGRFHAKSVTIPQNASREYKEHLKALVRRYKEDNHGNPIGEYVNTSDDHYGHAQTYAEIALPIAASLQTNSDIKAFT